MLYPQKTSITTAHLILSADDLSSCIEAKRFPSGPGLLLSELYPQLTAAELDTCHFTYYFMHRSL